MTTAVIDDARADAFEAFLASMRKEKPGEMMRLDGLLPNGEADQSAIVDIQVIPSGSIGLDYAIGAGGFPRSRIVEIYGPESGGKTTLALTVAKNAQDDGGIVGFVDAEHALNKELCDNVGIDPTRFAITQPDSGEQAIDKVIAMLDSGVFDVVIVDSVAALVPEAELNADLDQNFMGLHARLMSRFMRLVAGRVSKSGTCLILINQVRKNLGAYGTPDDTTGGRAIKFYSSLRIEVRTSPSKKIEKGKDIIGTRVTATVKKNKLGAPYKTCEYDVIFGKGIDASGDLLDVAEKMGIVSRGGASYTETSTGERIGIGKDNVKGILAEDDDLRNRLAAAVNAALRGTAGEPASVVPDDVVPTPDDEDADRADAA